MVIPLKKQEKFWEPRIQSLIALYFKTNTSPTSKCTALQGQGPVENSEPAQLYADEVTLLMSVVLVKAKIEHIFISSWTVL